MAKPNQKPDIDYQALNPRLNKYIPHKPTVKQTAGLLLPHKEILWGGAAGGGKSDWLLMSALQYVDLPGYAAILIRRTFSDLMLPGALIDRAQEWLAPFIDRGEVKWHDRTKTFTFPSESTLSFGYLETVNDLNRYQSSEYNFIGYDELSTFPEERMYTYLFSRLRRSTKSDIPLRMRSASNPGGVGHAWVKRRFLVDEDPARIFIPARLEDNPYIDQESYRAGLEELDPVTRQQLLNGDWDVTDAGGMFRRNWFGTIDPADTGAIVNHPEARLVRYWDKASSKPTARNKDPDYTVGLLMAELAGRFYILDVHRSRESPGIIRDAMRSKAETDGRAVPIVVEQEPGSSGQYDIDQLQRGELQGWPVYGDRPTGNKQERARPYSAAVYNGNVYIANTPWVTDFLDEHELFPDGPHDDQVDAASGAMRHLTAVPEPAIL